MALRVFKFISTLCLCRANFAKFLLYNSSAVLTCWDMSDIVSPSPIMYDKNWFSCFVLFKLFDQLRKHLFILLFHCLAIHPNPDHHFGLLQQIWSLTSMIFTKREFDSNINLIFPKISSINSSKALPRSSKSFPAWHISLSSGWYNLISVPSSTKWEFRCRLYSFQFVICQQVFDFWLVHEECVWTGVAENHQLGVDQFQAKKVFATVLECL